MKTKPKFACAFESLKLTKKQKKTETPYSDLSIGEMSRETLEVCVYNMLSDLKKIDANISKAYKHLLNAMP